MAILTKKEREALRDAEIERRGTDTVPKKKISHDFKNAIEALKIIDKYNRLNHDLDAYLMEVNEWGQGKGLKPNPEDFGIDEE